MLLVPCRHHGSSTLSPTIHTEALDEGPGWAPGSSSLQQQPEPPAGTFSGRSRARQPRKALQFHGLGLRQSLVKCLLRLALCRAQGHPHGTIPLIQHPLPPAPLWAVEPQACHSSPLDLCPLVTTCSAVCGLSGWCRVARMCPKAFRELWCLHGASGKILSFHPHNIRPRSRESLFWKACPVTLSGLPGPLSAVSPSLYFSLPPSCIRLSRTRKPQPGAHSRPSATAG